MTDNIAVTRSNYTAAVRALELKLARQVASVQATERQIEGFKALLDQLDGKAPKR